MKSSQWLHTNISQSRTKQWRIHVKRGVAMPSQWLVLVFTFNYSQALREFHTEKWFWQKQILLININWSVKLFAKHKLCETSNEKANEGEDNAYENFHRNTYKRYISIVVVCVRQHFYPIKVSFSLPWHLFSALTLSQTISCA